MEKLMKNAINLLLVANVSVVAISPSRKHAVHKQTARTKIANQVATKK